MGQLARPWVSRLDHEASPLRRRSSKLTCGGDGPWLGSTRHETGQHANRKEPGEPRPGLSWQGTSIVNEPTPSRGRVAVRDAAFRRLQGRSGSFNFRGTSRSPWGTSPERWPMAPRDLSGPHSPQGTPPPLQGTSAANLTTSRRLASPSCAFLGEPHSPWGTSHPLRGTKHSPRLTWRRQSRAPHSPRGTPPERLGSSHSLWGMRAVAPIPSRSPRFARG